MPCVLSVRWGVERRRTGRWRIQGGAVWSIERRTVGRCPWVRHRADRRWAYAEEVRELGDGPRGGEVIRKPGVPDTGIRPDVHAGAPTGVGDQCADGEVLSRVGQRPAAGLAAPPAPPRDERRGFGEGGG